MRDLSTIAGREETETLALGILATDPNDPVYPDIVRIALSNAYLRGKISTFEESKRVGPVLTSRIEGRL